MRRVVVIGPPGSGKSTLARSLGVACGLPVLHLDHAYWRPGWVRAPAEAFRAEVGRIAALPAWVIDGNTGGTLAPRLARADAVVFLDLPLRLTLPRVLRRALPGPARASRPEPALLRGCPCSVPEWLFAIRGRCFICSDGQPGLAGSGRSDLERAGLKSGRPDRGRHGGPVVRDRATGVPRYVAFATLGS